MKQLISALLLLFINIAFASEFIPSIKKFSQNEYQAGVENWSAISDTNGIMYFANSEGILEFDGIHWNLLKTNSGYGVRSLELGHDHLIYVGADYDFGYLKEDPYGKKEYVSFMDQLTPDVKSKIKQVWKVVCDSKYIYYLTYNTVLIFDYQHHFIKQIHEEIYLRSIYHIDNKIVAYNNQKGILIFNNTTLSFTTLYNSPEILNQSIEYIGTCPQGGLRLYIFRKGFYQLYQNKLKLEKSTANTFLNQEYAFCGAKGKDRIYIGTTTNGMCALNDTDLKENWFLNKSLGLNDNKIFDIYFDRFQNVWVCHENGLSYLSLSSPIRIIDDRLGISGQGFCSKIYKEQYFLGTSNGLFYAHNNSNYSLHNFKVFQSIRQPTYFIQEFGGKLLIGCHLELFVYDGHQLLSLNSTKTNRKAVLCPWNPDLVLLATNEGIAILSIKNNFNKVGYIIQDKNECLDFEIIHNQIWYVDPSNSLVALEIDTLTNKVKNITKYSDKHYYSITKFKQHLLMGTENGLYQIQANKNSPIVKISSDSLPISIIYNEDDTYLWLEKSSFAKGKQTYKIEILNKNFQLDSKTNEFNAIVASNKIFSFNHIPNSTYKVIGVTEGFVVLDVDQFFKNHTLQSYIRKLKFNLPNTQHSIEGLWKNFYQVQTPIYLDEKLNLEVDCASNIYNAHDKIYFSYIIEGKDTSWSNWLEQHQITIPIYDHGNYKLKIKATSDFHTYSKESEILFEIKKPWYLTYWWYSLEIVFLILVLTVSSYFNRKGNHTVSKISAFIIVLIILTFFETTSELVQDWLDAKGAIVFTLKIFINILIALTINPIENWLKLKLIKNPISDTF